MKKRMLLLVLAGLICFSGCTSKSPEPDTMLRVFMAWKPLHRSIEIPKQALKPTEREGFTVVEWGGCQVTDWE